ncbi:hypothetical protein [Anaeromicropila herbilytica]|uniref:Uncharacterized protein n=1 Tax=Anaeromicropila herbilytica TaxID=2785025 RepID=A0A7R7ID98_9FIRM|nr:hypothetical protein [Anaeromicropila herbilytica]BCN30696.1 hypothetical protein bsdtb5_19910 [Anaeromicropila herbilytica]
MYVNAKRIAFLGLLLAFTVIIVILSGIFEFNTLFLLAAASFLVGVAIRENGLRLGFGFLIASILLSFILAPNKIYCITYTAFAVYIFMVEFSWEKIAKLKSCKNRTVLFWIIKYITFNIMYVLILVLLPSLIYPGKINLMIYLALFFGGQVGILIFDYAYAYFQKELWNKIRKNLPM